MLNKIHNEDCLEGMKRIPDKSIDMILCDLPYGTTRNKWDSIIPLETLWKQYERIIKDNGAIVLTAQTPFDKVLGTSNLKLLKYEWIWDKALATGHLNAKKMPMKRHENILIFYKKLPIYNPQMIKGEPYNKGFGHVYSSNYGKQIDVSHVNETGNRYPTSIILKSNANRRGKFHPTQKPVSLFEYLIKTYTNEGETVLDNCMGSGTTAIACMNINRNFIGFELDEEYWRLANERIEQHKAIKHP
ncbi:MAG: site-specific DNA-methyltransferase [Bacillus sp. (in: firmicutes)]|uniref:DNA-methyltransferase n=1 Tax=Bacillus sp. TaxID=1409 RepID=UPI0039E6877E